jgi:hypothetical protein
MSNPKPVMHLEIPACFVVQGSGTFSRELEHDDEVIDVLPDTVIEELEIESGREIGAEIRALDRTKRYRLVVQVFES